jgi:hypothetical protein
MTLIFDIVFGLLVVLNYLEPTSKLFLSELTELPEAY